MRKLMFVAALLWSFCGTVPSAATQGSLPGSLDGCQEVNLFFTVDIANVRPLVPASYALSGEANGKATLFIRGFDCRELVWNGDTRAGTYPVAGTTVSVLVDSPDGTGVLNSYVLFIATNSPEYNELAWHTADNEVRVAHVKNFEIAFSARSPLITALTANAPAPTPSPFRASGTVTEHPGTRDAAVAPFLLNFWHDSTDATLKFAVTVEGLELAPAQVTITSGQTELAAMFGNGTATSDEGTSNHARFRRATVVRTLIEH